ncbi:NPCBM/NEW2 domain-containing protein, partial [Streptomyces sp. URMC 123]|uniref:NPCBM/NEW2 domain-containing protein n=1 Tax=Streptomyces sp. URMC 123 TaxID=3423403 RepID=UPI003F1A7504
DDMTLGIGAMRFSVYADGVRLWRSPVLRGSDPAIPVRVPLVGRRVLRLVVEPGEPGAVIGVANWARARVHCG